MAVHYWEEHTGRKQEAMMRILSTHLTPLDRQTMESVNIIEAERKLGESLNMKTEWGRAKILGILVTQPKGVSRAKKLEMEIV